MVDFLASFQLGARGAARPSDSQCASVEDLQLRLRHTLDSKVTPSRAEHLAVSLELSPKTPIPASLFRIESRFREGQESVNPSPEGLELLRATTEKDADGIGAARAVIAAEVLVNQPQDNPVLQEAVAEHIVGAVSAADGCVWTVTETARDSQGWTFTYICKKSYQHWNKQNAKAKSRALVGDYNRMDPDPVLSGRPAFDCRGKLTISFSQYGPVLVVRYNHTPLHRTVAELGALFKPPSKQLGPGAQKLQKTPKRTQEQKAQDSEKRSGKKRRSTNALGETRKTPQKRKKLRSGISQTAALPAPETSPERLAALSDDRASCPAVPSDSNQLSGEESPQDRTVNDHSAAPVGEEPANTGQGSAESESSLALTLSVTAEEAARRRKVALVMLKDAGVDPNTLSADQFSIFANQSPGLQKESLNMLAQYGAARLRIVRPPNRECSTSAPPNSEPPRSPVIVTEGQSTTKELVPHNEALVEKSSKKRKSGDGATRVTSAGAATSSSPQTPRQSKRRPGKSRVACYSCKSQRVKCSHEKPACSHCQAESSICEYPPPKPRKKKSDVLAQEAERHELLEQELQQRTEDEVQSQANHFTELGELQNRLLMEEDAESEEEPSNMMAQPRPNFFHSAIGQAYSRPDPGGMSGQPLVVDPDLLQANRQHRQVSGPDIDPFDTISHGGRDSDSGSVRPSFPGPPSVKSAPTPGGLRRPLPCRGGNGEGGSPNSTPASWPIMSDHNDTPTTLTSAIMSKTMPKTHISRPQTGYLRAHKSLEHQRYPNMPDSLPLSEASRKQPQRPPSATRAERQAWASLLPAADNRPPRAQTAYEPRAPTPVTVRSAVSPSMLHRKSPRPDVREVDRFLSLPEQADVNGGSSYQVVSKSAETQPSHEVSYDGPFRPGDPANQVGANLANMSMPDAAANSTMGSAQLFDRWSAPRSPDLRPSGKKTYPDPEPFTPSPPPDQARAAVQDIDSRSSVPGSQAPLHQLDSQGEDPNWFVLNTAGNSDEPHDWKLQSQTWTSLQKGFSWSNK